MVNCEVTWKKTVPFTHMPTDNFTFNLIARMFSFVFFSFHFFLTFLFRSSFIKWRRIIVHSPLKILCCRLIIIMLSLLVTFFDTVFKKKNISFPLHRRRRINYVRFLFSSIWLRFRQFLLVFSFHINNLIFHHDKFIVYHMKIFFFFNTHLIISK